MWVKFPFGQVYLSPELKMARLHQVVSLAGWRLVFREWRLKVVE